MATELIARINGHAGRVVVERLRFVQEALPGPAMPTPALVRAPPPAAIPDAQQDDEFTCSSCFLVHHRSRLAREKNGQYICRDCA